MAERQESRAKKWERYDLATKVDRLMEDMDEFESVSAGRFAKMDSRQWWILTTFVGALVAALMVLVGIVSK